MIIDLRMPEERHVGVYTGSVSLPVPKPPVDVDWLRKRLRRFVADVPQSEAISVYCAKGVRSSFATSLLKDMGFTDVTNLGGFRR